MKNMNEKIENLRNLLNGREVRYEELERICYRNDSVPSISSLKKYNVLVMRMEEVETVMDENEWENEFDECDEYFDEFHWDDDRELYVMNYFIHWYSVR